MNLSVFRGDNIHDYHDTDAEWNFEFDIDDQGILKIYKIFLDTRRPKLVAAYPKGEWLAIKDISL